MTAKECLRRSMVKRQMTSIPLVEFQEADAAMLLAEFLRDVVVWYAGYSAGHDQGFCDGWDDRDAKVRR